MLVAAIGIPRQALADDATTPPAPAPVPAIATSTAASLTSQAAGPRLPLQSQALQDSTSPVTIRLEYTGEISDNAAGGLRDGASYMNNVLAQLHLDAAQVFGWTGGSFVAEGFYENATSLDTQYVGAIQDPSVIDTSGVAVFRVYQAYYKQNFGDTNVLLGIYDAQTEFGSTKPMDIFFNGAYAWTTTLDQSGLNGPSSYPSTSFGLRVRQKFGPYWRIQAAVLDGEPDSAKDPRATAVNFNKTNGALLIGEVDYLPSRTAKIMAGFWDYTGAFPAIDETATNGLPRQVFGSAGGYVGGATRLYSLSPHRGLDVFATFGFADGTRQIVDRSLNAGLTFTGPFDDRPNDKFGIAVGTAHAGDAYRHAQIASNDPVNSYETNFEMTYRAQINGWLTIQPDVQYWIDPDVDPALKNDLLIMIHFEISHAFNL
jgi:porin